jgi:hypothetical protein
MQILEVNNRLSASSVLTLMMPCLFFLLTDCRNSKGVPENSKKTGTLNQITGPEDSPAYVKFHSFQNPDSSWGFTIVVNSRPFRQYNKIPVKGSTSGFASKKEAEVVAEIFTNMIRKGELTPKLSKQILDTLKITIEKQ